MGSKEAGPRVAAILSIVETCRRLSLPIRDYLASVLPGLENFTANRVAELTPSVALAASTTYRAALSATIKDAIGNPLAPVTWTFTTAG